MARVVASVGVPVLFLGGPIGDAGRAPVLDEVRDVMAGGGGGMAMGRTDLPGPRPGRDGRAWSPDWSTHDDPDHRLRHHGDQGRRSGTTRAGRRWPAPSSTTAHPQVGWAEQDPLRWWTSVVIACAEARAQAPAAFGQVDVVACSGARQTFVPVTRAGDPIGKGILWSDRRGAAEARGAGRGAWAATTSTGPGPGIPLDAGSVAAKLAWLAAHEPDRLDAVRPRPGAARPGRSCA